jgi:hypothetical protein
MRDDSGCVRTRDRFAREGGPRRDRHACFLDRLRGLVRADQGTILDLINPFQAGGGDYDTLAVLWRRRHGRNPLDHCLKLVAPGVRDARSTEMTPELRETGRCTDRAWHVAHALEIRVRLSQGIKSGEPRDIVEGVVFSSAGPRWPSADRGMARLIQSRHKHGKLS